MEKLWNNPFSSGNQKVLENVHCANSYIYSLHTVLIQHGNFSSWQLPFRYIWTSLDRHLCIHQQMSKFWSKLSLRFFAFGDSPRGKALWGDKEQYKWWQWGHTFKPHMHKTHRLCKEWSTWNLRRRAWVMMGVRPVPVSIFSLSNRGVPPGLLKSREKHL